MAAWPPGPAVLAILDGDRFAGARLVDLAANVVMAGAPFAPTAATASGVTGEEPEHLECGTNPSPTDRKTVG